MFPAPVRAACAQVGLVPTSVRALRTLGRATAAWRSGGATQEAASGAAKVAIPAILTHLPDPGLAVRLQDCKVSTFGCALRHLDQVQAAWRAAARHWWQFAAVAKSRGFAAWAMMGGDDRKTARQFCDFLVALVCSSMFLIICTTGRSEQLFPAWAGVPRLALPRGTLSLSARALFCAPPPPAPPAVPVWPPRARWRRDWRLLFRRGSKQGVCPAPRVLRLSWPCLPLPATHTLTRVAAWVGPQDHAAGPESLDTGCRPSWARRCTTRRSSTTVRAARSSPVRIRSHCRGTAHEPRPASAAAAGAASGSTPTSLPGTRSTHPLSLFSTVLSSGPVASALALATGLGRCLPGV